MYSFNYLKPVSIEDAASMLSESDEHKVISGGMTLIPTLKQRLARVERLIGLEKCGLSEIKLDGELLKIGAMATHAEVSESDIVVMENPAIAELASHIGDRQVRNRGTIGGSLANNDPSACYPAAILALGGIIHTTKRDIKAEEFFVDLFETALEEDEIITAVSLPKPDAAAYEKFPNPASRYAMVGVFVAKFNSEIRVAVTGAGEEGVFRCSEIETALLKAFSSESLSDCTISADGLMNDIHAEADYRAHLIVEMAKRAVTKSARR
jgi:carbon-monoxide dehydrogenase medium subunit